MKNVYFVISLLFIGCSSTYTLKDFSSQNEFYKNFNDFAESREADVYLSPHNFITGLEGTKIKNDSLYIVINYQKEYTALPLNEIKNIKYNNYFNNTENRDGYLILANKEELKAVDIKTLKDSVYFTNLKSTLKCVPITGVNKIIFKRTGTGIFSGILIGAPLGFLIGGYTYQSISSSSTPSYVWKYYYIGSPVIGRIIGGIIGWLKGDYIYLF